MKKTLSYVAIIVAFVVMCMALIFGIAQPKALPLCFWIAFGCTGGIYVIAHCATNGSYAEKSYRANMFLAMAIISGVMLFFGGIAVHHIAAVI